MTFSDAETKILDSMKMWRVLSTFTESSLHNHHYFTREGSSHVHHTLNSPDPRVFHVLVVEDDFQQRQLLKEVLAAAELEVTCAIRPIEALSILQCSGGIDLLVTDIGLSGPIDGGDLVHQALQHRPQLPVLFITGFGPERLKLEKYVSLHAEVVFKPFSLAEFLGRVKDLLHRPSTADFASP